MNVILMHGGIVGNDAIGNDILGMYRTLQRTHNCVMFADVFKNIDGSIVSYASARALLADLETLAIYHHSIYWNRGEDFITHASAKVVFRYHNITPATFFAPGTHSFKACTLGREQTDRLIAQFPSSMWMAASDYSITDLLSVSHRRVVPPFLVHGRESVSYKPSTATERDCCVLMVGRIAPHKGHFFALDILEQYRAIYGSTVQLLLVGKLESDCRDYAQALLQAIANRGLDESCRYLGEVDNHQLLSLYMHSTALLCCSEHEGFCVPIAEAQMCGLPVLARARAAIPETLGTRENVLGEDPIQYAHRLHELVTNEIYRNKVISDGVLNYKDRFSPAVIRSTFLTTLREVQANI